MSSIVYTLVGGLLLGIATVGYLYINGRIAGISGLLAQFISPSRDIFKSSAFWFIAGLVITPFIYGYFYQPEIEIKANSFVLILAGLLVGFGTTWIRLYKWAWHLWNEQAIKTLNNSDRSFYVCWHADCLCYSPCVGVIL